MNQSTTRPAAPKWVMLAAALGIAWSIFGVVQLVGTLNQTPKSLMMGGMTAVQAETYYSMPFWTTIAFAVGVFGGLLGSVVLLLRRQSAVVILLVSLAAYCVLWLADLYYGVFAVLPSQMPILTTVVAIALALLVTAVVARRADHWTRAPSQQTN